MVESLLVKENCKRVIRMKKSWIIWFYDRGDLGMFVGWMDCYREDGEMEDVNVIGYKW